MAQQQRPAPKSKPITANPLFPVVVALWFAMALGGCSAALSTSALEGLVRSSGIDLVIPAAAPPLGLTARILVALLMAAFGALIGSLIGRRLARPKPKAQTRKRSARNRNEEEASARLRDAFPDAPLRKPISVHEELGEEPAQEASVGILANRRRPLTVEPQEVHFVPVEVAPLPAGDLQVLDLTGAELDQPALTGPAPAPIAPALQETIDLNAYADGYAETPDSDQPAEQPDAAPFDAPSGQPALQERQVFDAAASVEPAVSVSAEDHALSGRQVFGMTPVEPQAASERQIFGTDPVQPVADAGFRASVFDATSAEPLFAPRAVIEPASLPTDEVAPLASLPEAPASPEPQHLEPAAVYVPTAAEIVAEPAPRIDLEMLAMDDLAIRLRESMRRRRAARAAPLAATAAPIPSLPAGSGDDPEPIERLPSGLGQPALPASMTPRAPMELPVALRPLALDELPEQDDDDDTLLSLLPPRYVRTAPSTSVAAPSPAPQFAHVANPDADSDDEDLADDAAFASLLSVNGSAPRSSFVRVEVPDEATGEVEPLVIFPGQAPRVTLGASPAQSAPDVAPVVSPDAPEVSELRRFDAPSHAAPGQAIAANGAAPSIDSDEADRSLRLALANLQRISGAA